MGSALLGTVRPQGVGFESRLHNAFLGHAARVLRNAIIDETNAMCMRNYMYIMYLILYLGRTEWRWNVSNVCICYRYLKRSGIRSMYIESAAI